MYLIYCHIFTSIRTFIHSHLMHVDLLGERLECEDEGRFRDNANLCYICSGNVDKFVACW